MKYGHSPFFCLTPSFAKWYNTIMRIEYNHKEILKLLNDFSNCTNLIASLQFDNVFLTSDISSANSAVPTNFNSYETTNTHFCHFIHSNVSVDVCKQNDLRNMERAKKEKRTVISSCHAGLCEIVTPIVLDNVIVGYIMCGKFIDAEREYSSIDKIKDAARKYSLDEKLLSELYAHLPVLSKSMVESALNILNVCIKHLLQEHFLKMRNNEFSAQLHEYIVENLAQPLTVDHLCKIFFTNKQKLNTVFKEAFHDTVRSYIIKERIEKAKKLLSETKKSIDEISCETGFPNYTYFIKIFKKRTGFSPLQYRKKFSSP